MVADNVDRVLAAGAGSNGGIFKAMEDLPGATAFGVDVNQCPQAPGLVMDNVEKKHRRRDREWRSRASSRATSRRSRRSASPEGGMTLTGLEPGRQEVRAALIADYPDVIAKVKAIRDEIVIGRAQDRRPDEARQVEAQRPARWLRSSSKRSASSSATARLVANDHVDLAVERGEDPRRHGRERRRQDRR